MKILIINGPNLNLLGIRQPEIYGEQGFESYLEELRKSFPQIDLEYFQSNIEGELIDKIQQVGFSYQGIILNAGGFTHTSVALADAVAAIDNPTVEVHISNPAAREPYRHTSLLAQYVKGSIAGFGLSSYRLAILSLTQ